MKRVSSNPRSASEENPKTRRRFLKGLLGATGVLLTLGAQGRARASLFKDPVTTNHLRPPGAVPEEIFLGKCIRCGRCAEVCSYLSIKMLDARWGVHAGTPIIHVEEIPCYLCMKCVEVCPTGTLQKIKQAEVRMGLAVVNRRQCLSWKGDILCRSCYNACPFKEKAIYMKDQVMPVVNEKYCTGCGLCTKACPTHPKAININPIYANQRVKW